MTIIILSFLSLILIPLFKTIEKGGDPVIRARGVALAQALMDEIMNKKFDENTPMGGGPLVTGESPSGAGTGTTCTPCDGNRLYCYHCIYPSYIEQNASAIGLEANDHDGSPAASERSKWDDVDDYDFLNKSAGKFEKNTFWDQDGNKFTMKGYKRTVTVTYIPSNAGTITEGSPPGGKLAAQATDTKRVVVTVTMPNGEIFSLVSLKCNF